MDKKLKAKWVKALRSGRYPQAGGWLMDPEGKGFCCLGVLCKVAGARDSDIDRAGFPADTGNSKLSGLIDHGTARKLATLNDEGVPFEMIAGLIHEAL